MWLAVPVMISLIRTAFSRTPARDSSRRVSIWRKICVWSW